MEPDHRAVARLTGGARAALVVACAGVVGVGLSAPVLAQDVRVAGEPSRLAQPEIAPALSRMLDGDYLDDNARRDLRLRHGLWTDDDLADIEARASAMLACGSIDDPSLSDPDADALDRAEACLLRGELRESLTLLEGRGEVRALRIRAEALESMGRFDEADAALDPLVSHMSARTIDDADELVEGVRGLIVRSRLRGPGRAGSAGADSRTILTLLARARTEIDRLHWPARMAEAELLLARDNIAEAAGAAQEVIALHPRCARAWRLLGDLAVRSFDFERSELLASKLEELAPGTPDAACVRARAALRQRDPARAQDILAQALARFPRHRELLALRCAATAADFDTTRCEALLGEFDALDGPAREGAGSPGALLNVGRTLAEARQYEAGASYLTRASARQPNLPEPLIELGLLEVQRGRDMKAKDALERALELDPFNTRAANSLDLVRTLQGYSVVEGEHFLVRYAPGPDSLLAGEMVAILEAIHGQVCGPEMFDHEPEGRTLVELMPDHATFAVRIGGMPTIHTMAASTGPVIAMESPRVGRGNRSGTYDWARTVRHEYIHTVTLSRTNNRIPHWFTEAAAVWGEGAPRDEVWWRILSDAYREDRLFDMRTISLRFVRPESPTDRTQAYAQGHWMYEFMVESHGPGAPLALMDLYAKGLDQDRAMREALGVGEQEFFERFQEWAAGELRSAGLLAREGELPVEKLVEMLNDPTPEEVIALLETYPEHPGVLALAVEATVSLRGGRAAPEDIPLLERCAAARPFDPMPRRHLARLALDGALEDSPARAVEHLEFLDVREQRSPAYAAALSARYAAMGDLDRAWKKVVRAMTIAPFDARLREEAARIALLRNDRASAEHQLEALAILEPERELHRRRLEAFRASGTP